MERMSRTEIVCESNVDVRRAVGMPDTNWLDSVEKACGAKSLELKDVKLSARVESSGEK